jgi:hypothetical protein
VTLPLFAHMTDEQLELVVDAVCAALADQLQQRHDAHGMVETATAADEVFWAHNRSARRMAKRRRVSVRGCGNRC